MWSLYVVETTINIRTEIDMDITIGVDIMVVPDNICGETLPSPNIIIILI